MSRLGIITLLLAIVVVIVAFGGLTKPQDYGPVVPTGSFVSGGEYPGEPLAQNPKPRTWGSWAGSDANTGELRIGPFLAPQKLRLFVSGYPHHADGNALYLELVDLKVRYPLPADEAREMWRENEFEIPAGFQGRLVTLVASDHAQSPGGWLAISEPLPVKSRRLPPGLATTLLAWLAWAAASAGLFFATACWLQERARVPEPWIPLAAASGVAIAGYVGYWVYLLGPNIGRAYSWTVWIGGLALTVRAARRTRPATAGTLRTVVLLATTIGLGYLAVLHLFDDPRSYYELAANRFIPGLPGDNRLPHDFAVRLYHGESVKGFSADWQSSDRPPVQSGCQLLWWPLLAAVGFDDITISFAGALWLQLMWVFSAYGLLRTFLDRDAEAAGFTALLALSGFLLLNTLYTWPKLLSAAWMGGAFCLLLSPAIGGSACGMAAIFISLAWLSHGSVAFSILALLPFIWRERAQWRGPARWRAVAVLALFGGSWMAYQHFYDPPGDRLLKWHLAGQPERDQRSLAATIRHAYTVTPPAEILRNKLLNVWLQWQGAGTKLRSSFETHPDIQKVREAEFFYTLASLAGWLLAVPGYLVARWRLRPRTLPLGMGRMAAWAALTVVITCGLLFLPTATTQHSSFAAILALLVLLAVLARRAGSWVLGVIVLVQAVALARVWLPRSPLMTGAIDGYAVLLLLASGLALICFGLGAFGRADQNPLETPPPDPAFGDRAPS